MSGGVDSSVAAALLKEQGHEVAGATIRTWAPNDCADLNTRACCGLTGVEDARSVAEKLDIPYWVFNFEKEFKTHVVDYFAKEYMKGRTPNPCIACNEHIKFRIFLNRARQLGYDTIATGHYARLAYDAAKDVISIHEGSDPSKDQSYVLFPLDQDVLKNLVLPLGNLTKAEIRRLARDRQLCVMDKPDSQEICFIPSNDYGAFLSREYVNQPEKRGAFPVAGEKGLIKSTDGEVMGEHEGYYHYTRGQRRGLRVPYKERLYVVETRPETNEVIVGTKKEVFQGVCKIGRVNWFRRPEGSEPFRAHVKIRSQHRKAAATVEVTSEKSVRVFFDEPQDAITPGQAAVIYDGASVLGGGWIDSYETA